MELEIKSCKQSNGEKFHIFPIGIEEKTEIELDAICECDCDAKTESKSDEYCSSNGNLKCGVCECDSTSFGDRCQCTENNLANASFTLNDECVM